MPATSLHGKIKAAVVDVIAQLGLPEIDDRVWDQLTPDRTNRGLPAVLVTLEDEQEEVIAGTTEEDDTGFPVRVLFVDRDAASRDQRQELYLGWREAVLGAFRSQERAFKAAVPSVYWIRCEPRLIYDRTAEAYRLVVSALRLTFITRQLRS